MALTARQLAAQAKKAAATRRANAAAAAAVAVADPELALEAAPEPALALAPRGRRRCASNDLGGSDTFAAIAALEMRRLQAQVELEEERVLFQREDRERRITQDERESQARINALATTSSNTTSTAPGDPLGELSRSPEVQRFCALFPLVPQKQLVRVYKWPNADYDPSEIYKLCQDSAFDSIDDTFESTMTLHGLVHTKRKGRKEDYKTPTSWSTAFSLWTAIRVTYSKDLDLYLKLFKFHAKIIRLAGTYV